MKSLRLLFPRNPEDTKASLILLASRLIFGLTFASHGLDKLEHFAETAAHFPAPFGMDGDVAVALSIFGELICGVAFAIGFLTRLTILPMIFTMFVAFTTVLIIVFILSNLLVDLLYAALDPRIRYV